MRSTLFLLAVSGALLLAGCGGEQQQRQTQADAAAPGGAAPPSVAAPQEPSVEEARALLATLPAPFDQGDLENGRRQYAKCRSCHTLHEGGANMNGPNLHGVFGRQAGGVAGFRYSDALRAADFAWNAERLDAWLQDPKGYLPGNRMSFVGVRDATDRRDLIAFLKVRTGYSPAAG